MPSVDWHKLNFEEAIAYFQAKLVNVPTGSWQEIWQEEHDRAFSVAGAMAADLLADLRAIVEGAIADGMTRVEFAREFDAIVARHGWAYNGSRNWRTDTIYGTNLRVAYSAGRFQQMTRPEVTATRPYWMWIHGDSRMPRPLHKALHGRVFRFDDPFWRSMYPPCGFGCRCQVVTLSERDLRRRSKVVEPAPPVGSLMEVSDPKTGKKIPVRVEPDAGWDYVPGASQSV